jgi:hypothetical protein
MSINVLLTEEYGYRSWYWSTELGEDELIDWWKNQAQRPRITKLPGEIFELYPNDREGPCNWFLVKDYGDIYGEINIPRGGWEAHIHDDEDTYLQKPDGETVKHKGSRNVEDWFGE